MIDTDDWQNGYHKILIFSMLDKYETIWLFRNLSRLTCTQYDPAKHLYQSSENTNSRL